MGQDLLSASCFVYRAQQRYRDAVEKDAGKVHTPITTNDADWGTLYWTLSLPVAVPTYDRLPPGAKKVLAAKIRNLESTESLCAATETMFHDVADRPDEQDGSHRSDRGDFPAKSVGQMARHIILTLGDASDEHCALTWTSEGTTCTANLGPVIRKSLTLRRFWFVHNDGSLTYHLSFKLARYEHSPADFFFISMLQKLAAPSEFKIRAGQAPRLWTEQDVLPFDAFKITAVLAGARKTLKFWTFVETCLAADAAELFGQIGWPLDEQAAPVVKNFPEAHGLLVPDSRSMFSFKDRVLFELLLPKQNFVPIPRHNRIFDSDYRLVSKIVRRLTVGGRTLLNDQFWAWLENGEWDVSELKIRASHLHGEEAGKDTLDELLISDERRVSEWPSFRRDRLRYLFMAGFNQNVIDFLNQDASEVLDSLDPIYPTGKEEIEERFFVRYANPRSLISYAKTWRSLEIGERHIGNCPYLFLIHVQIMHNERLAAEFEDRATKLISDAATWHRTEEYAKASDDFYKFRLDHHLPFEQTYLDNNFRYNTEREVFDTVQAIRGVTRKHARIGKLLALLEQETHSTENRISGRNGYVLNGMVAALAIFTVGDVLQGWSTARTSAPTEPAVPVGALAIVLQVSSFLMHLAGIALFGMLMFFLGRLVVRWAANRLGGEKQGTREAAPLKWRDSQ